MSLEQLLQLASLGGFVFSSVVLSYMVYTLFNSLRNGEFVSKVYHDATVKQLTDANEGLRTDLRAVSAANTQLAKAVDGMADILQRHDADVRERVAGLKASVDEALRGRGR